VRKPRPGYEVLELDLDQVPSIEVGLADAAERRRAFVPLLRQVLGTGPNAVLFREHLPFSSFVNRATSLHLGVVSAVREENPHAAFTLLRAYLELVVLVYYLIDHVDYIDAIERPMSELPPGTRKRWSELFEYAARELAGVRTVYANLSEMGHFGSAAMWTPFELGGDDERMIRFGSMPHWKRPEDARMALAMLKETDESMHQVLARYAVAHIAPKVAWHEDRERFAAAITAYGGTPPGDDGSAGSLPPEQAAALEAAGLITWCEEHQALETADGVTPDQLEAWVKTELAKA
jgi:hypothetical protein